MPSTVDDAITEIMARVLKLAPDRITDASDVANTPNWDSTNHMRIVLAIEEKFGIEFSDDDIISMTTVVKMRETAAALLAAKA